MPHSIDVSIEYSEAIPFALGDSDQLKIVFANLFRNARDAMPNGGNLSVDAKESDGEIAISVTDTGVGIEPELLGRVMEPLFTTKARGIGLGLAMARAIVDKNNGSLDVKSKPGQGTTFFVHLHSAAESPHN